MCKKIINKKKGGKKKKNTNNNKKSDIKSKGGGKPKIQEELVPLGFERVEVRLRAFQFKGGAD